MRLILVSTLLAAVALPAVADVSPFPIEDGPPLVLNDEPEIAQAAPMGDTLASEAPVPTAKAEAALPPGAEILPVAGEAATAITTQTAQAAPAPAAPAETVTETPPTEPPVPATAAQAQPAAETAPPAAAEAPAAAAAPVVEATVPAVTAAPPPAATPSLTPSGAQPPSKTWQPPLAKGINLAGASNS